MSDDPLNLSIDETARQMTARPVADAAGFRRRVLARIDAGGAPRRSWRAAFVLAPIAAAAVILAGILVARPPQTAAPVVQQADPKGPALQIDGPKGPALQTARTQDTAPVGRPGPFGPGAPAPAPAFEANDVASIDIAPLGVDTIAPDPIPIDRLETLAPISVAPLDGGDAQRR